MRLVAACEAFREREGSSAPGVLCNNILMNEKLATRSFERNHWLLSGLCPDHVSALSEARFHNSVKSGEVLFARSIEPFEGGRWQLRWMRANGWSRSNGYGN